MVIHLDRQLVEPRLLDDQTKLKVLLYVWREKGVSSRELGVSPQYLNMVKRGARRVSDALFLRAVEYLTVEEYAELTNPSIEVVDLGTVVKVLRAALADPKLREVVISMVSEALGEAMKSAVKVVRVTDEHLRRFEAWLSTRAKSTADTHRCYLRRALKRLNFKLSGEALQDLILELYRESPCIASHTFKALKAFIKHAVRDKVLYHSFTFPSMGATSTDGCGLFKDVPTLDEVRAVARAIEWPPAKAYYCLLAETGMRPGEPFTLKLVDVDLEGRVVKPKRLTASKRAYLSFFSPELANYLREVYLPYRERWVKRIERGVVNLIGAKARDWRQMFLPFKAQHLRAAIYEAMGEALGKRFRLYDLRAFHATYLSMKGVPGQVINLLQGRTPPREFQILVHHYLAFKVEDLRKLYDRAGLTVLS